MNYTAKYFEKHNPGYSAQRFKPITKWISSYVNPSILDVGCGDGSLLKYLNDLNYQNLSGIDQSKSYLKIARKKVKAHLIEQDILRYKTPRRYDVVVMIAVLHHLIGRTRQGSKELSKNAILNCLSLSKENGSVMIMEPVFSNVVAMSALFYLKKLLSRLSNERITLFGHWNNIGAPIVSYFSSESLKSLIEDSGCQIAKEKYIPALPNRLYRFFGVKRGDLYLLIERIKK